nr:immune inhibitor A domain-containing protein [Streptomyces californicus]
MSRARSTSRKPAAALTLAVMTAAVSALTFAQAQGQEPSAPVAVADHDPATHAGHVDHDLEGPFSEELERQRESALQMVLSGEAEIKRRAGSQVVRLDQGKYVELGRERTDKIFAILVEFGDKVDDTTTHDPDGSGPNPPVKKYGGKPGPLHNKIAEPDRSVNNSTAWQADFDRKHYQELYFGKGTDTAGQPKHSLKTYYEKASSGRYSVDGHVSDWVKVEYNEARYGANYCGRNNCPNAWELVRDGVNAWAAAQKAKGRSTAQIKADLAEYDTWDRYDYDDDGDFNEPDGYIDHFQVVHAGEDESAGGGAQGKDALWAHRWYAYGTSAGKTGPDSNKAGGAQIGDTGTWVGDYTVQAENGGLGVFAHEYGHDLGLPDLYDTSGRDDAENSTGFWSLMSSGSWLNRGKDSIGDMPGDMTAWDKLQLGWLNYAKVTDEGRKQNSTHKLGVSAYNTELPQALLVELPKKSVTTEVVAPAQGTTQWWSGSGDKLNNTLTRSVDLTGRSQATLELQAWYDIETDYDYLYTEVSTDGGAKWTALDGTVDGKAIPRDGNGAPALTGASGAHKKLVHSLDAYAGKKIDLRFRYHTDGATAGKGFTADTIRLTADGAEIFSDDAEAATSGWTAKGFSRTGKTVTSEHEQFYLAENRQYVSYDTSLKTGPYNYGFTAPKNKWVERYPYQNGLLIWQWDTSQKDNNTSVHPGEGLVLPVDAHPEPLKWSDGTLMSNRLQSFDSAFGRMPTDLLRLHLAGVPTYVMPRAGNPVFDDSQETYWHKETARAGVRVRDTGTKVEVLREAPHGQTVTVQVGPSAD